MNIKINYLFYVFILNSIALFSNLPWKNSGEIISQAKYYALLPSPNNTNPKLKFILGKSNDFSLSEELFFMIAKAYKAEAFVETGTYMGNSTFKASHYFNRVHSIELSKEFFERAQNRFQNNSNIFLYHGDSSDIISLIIPKISQHTVFFLDGHFSEWGTAKGKLNTPILAELENIKNGGIKDAFIIIDDVRQFYEPRQEKKNTTLEGYPTITDLVDKILEINSDYSVAIVADFLIAFPAGENISVSPLITATTISRLFDSNNFHLEDVLEAERYIAHATGNERDTIIRLVQLFINDDSIKYRISRHYALWYGLILLADKKFDEALRQFEIAEKSGFTHWRINWYKFLASSHISI